MISPESTTKGSPPVGEFPPGAGQEPLIPLSQEKAELIVRDLLRRDKLADRIGTLETRLERFEGETREHYATKQYADGKVNERAKAVKEDAKWIFWMLIFAGFSTITTMLAVLGLIARLVFSK